MAIMAKAPRVGAAKTRLVPALSPAEAAQLSACFIRDAAENIVAAGRTAMIDGYIAYAPADAAAEFATLVGEGTRLLPSRRAGLGASLADAAQDLLAAGYGAVCLVNSDSPTLPTAILVAAAQALAAPGDRLVLGPAEDGGYYLIGMKQPHPRLFEDIAWSTASVFPQTLARAREIGLDPVVLPAWYDVDDVASLHRAHGELRGKVARAPARHTSAFLRSLVDAGRIPRAERGPTGAAAGSDSA
jgi:rSAM/selenodomain-associated transferase 1